MCYDISPLNQTIVLSLSATSPTAVFLTLSVSPLSLCAPFSSVSVAVFFFSPNPFSAPVHEAAVGMTPLSLLKKNKGEDID